MDLSDYREAVDRMQKMNVDADYIQGWIGGYMKNPKREEQRVSEAYEAGYEDGGKGEVGDLKRWI